MDLQEIDVFIDQDGSVRVEVRGVKGFACLPLTDELERVLGGRIITREMTHEANELGQDELSSQQRLEGGTRM